MYKAPTRGYCSPQFPHSGEVNKECQTGGFDCGSCKGKLKCNNCTKISLELSEMEILAYNIRSFKCFQGSTVTVNAYNIDRVECHTGCTMILNAYQVGRIKCARFCRAKVRVNNGTHFVLNDDWDMCKDTILHHNFEEFCYNIGLLTTVAPTLAATTAQTTTEYETTGSYFIL